MCTPISRKIMAFWLPCVATLLLFSLPGCVHKQEATSAEIQTFRSGDLHVPVNKDAPNTLYVDVSPKDGRHVSAAQIGKALSGGKFRITDSPSKAGYILHISLVDEGKVSPGVLESLVNAGYGSRAKFSGHGATAILTDALLVQRSVPSSSRPSRAKLKNITRRNALGSTQMRIGILVPQESVSRDSSNAVFTNTLIRELENAMYPQGQASAESE